MTPDLEDVEALIKRCESAAQKQAKKYFNDEKASQKMTASQCRSYICDFVEAVMGSMSGFLSDKEWFDKVTWNGALLMLVVNTFSNGKIFTRTLKTEITPFIDEGLLAWSEEERLVRQFWKALEAGGVSDNQKKKGNTHLLKSYDEAHWESPYGSMEGDSLTPEVATLQEFTKGWMGIFAEKAYSVLENGTQDGSPAGQVATLTAIFQTLMDPDSPCVPLSIQPSVPPAPWSYIEQCANEVILKGE